MNAPTNISVPNSDSDAQSLTGLCRDRRWNLLQQFARLEIALKNKLENPPKTFGAKVRAWIRLDPAAKRFEELIAVRNLVAHAAINCVRIEATTFALWEIADSIGALNCAKFDKPSLTSWSRRISGLLDEAIALA